MMHAFTAGAWNPRLMKAGFAAMLTDGTDDDGLTAEGSLDCEKAADSVRAEMFALQGVGLLLKLSCDGDTAVVHPTDPEVHGRVMKIAEQARVRLFRQGTEFTDYFGDGAFLQVLDPRDGVDDPVFKAYLDRVQEMACIKAGLLPEPPGETEENA